MKKLFVLGFAVMAFGASLFANGNESLIEKLNEKTTQKAIARYINADYKQQDDLNFVFGESQKKIDAAKSKGSDVDAAAQKAMVFSLANAKTVLSSDQYRKFLTVLNMTLTNNSTAGLYAAK